MSAENVSAFFASASENPELQEQLARINSDAENPEDAREDLKELAASAGFEFTDSDYLKWYVSQSYSYLVEASGNRVTAEQAAPVTSPLQPYAQYGFPYSAFPPIPPPMPTYLPPPPYIPIPQQKSATNQASS